MPYYLQNTQELDRMVIFYQEKEAKKDLRDLGRFIQNL